MVEETQPANETGPEEEEQEEAVEEQPAEGPSAEELSALKQEAEGHIDAFMKQVGYNPPDRTDEAGWRYFTLGTADGRAGVVQVEDGLFLRVEALVMTMPSDKELILPLMRELLNINIELAGPVRLGIEGDNVYTALLYPVKALKDEQYPDMIHWTMALADQIDDGLIKKYGGTVKTRGDQPVVESAGQPIQQPEGDHA